MKNWIVILLVALNLRSMGQERGFMVSGISSIAVPATSNKMTNLIFPGPIQTAVKVSRDILVQKVHGVANVIELKAARPDFTETNLTVYGRDGQVYSFIVRYARDSTVLNFRILANDRDLKESPVQLTGLPTDVESLNAIAKKLAGKAAFLHSRTTEGRIRLQLTGAYIAQNLEWLTFHISNRSRIPFELADVRFFLVDRKQVKRRAIQEDPVDTVFANIPLVIAGETEKQYAVSFKPFAVPAGKRLVVMVAGLDGGRTLFLRVRSKLLLKARGKVPHFSAEGLIGD
jgi:conjugative transposon TraN protein